MNLPARLLTAVATVCLLLASPFSEAAQHCAAQKRKNAPKTSATTTRPQSVEDLRKKRQQESRTIKDTNRKLNTNTRETRRQLNRLETLRGDMKRQSAIMARARQSADSVNHAIARLNDTIAGMDSTLRVLRASYGAALRRMQAESTPSSALSFVLSSESFEQAYRRVRYLRQFTKWRRRKGEELKKAQAELAERRARLALLGRERGDALQRLNLATSKLRSQQAETENLVASLKKEEGNLRQLLRESEARRNKLDGEIDRLIRAEQERQERLRREEEARAAARRQKPGGGAPTETAPAKETPRSDKEVLTADADRKLSGSFESNKGRLLFPVAGSYSIARAFGRQQHPELKHVETENSGIDIEARRNAPVRSVFDGTVSAIFRQPGFNTIVMVRHGRYITIYAGLGTLSVKNGEKVKTGQTLGTIAPDPDNDNRSILHFEIRRERQKLDPSQWVK